MGDRVVSHGWYSDFIFVTIHVLDGNDGDERMQLFGSLNYLFYILN